MKLKKTLEKIKKHYKEINSLLNDIPNDERNKMLKFHHDNATLPHCSRWGLTGVIELIDNICKCEACEKEWIELEDPTRDYCDDCLEESE